MGNTSGNPAEEIPEEIEKYIEGVKNRLDEAKSEMGRAILGQEKLIEEVVMTLVAGGNILLEGPPGTAKTELIKTIGQVFGLKAQRIQCTPDLMPSDILGAEIMEEDKTTGRRAFRFLPGPVFANVVMFDEINRASPRTQSASLQAMQEKKVTVAGETHHLPTPFHVQATQNPIEQEGTNPLPEAQLDRFLFKSLVFFPDRESERKIALGTTGTHYSWEEIANEDLELELPENSLVKVSELKQVFNEKSLIHIQHAVRKLPIGKKPMEAILDIVRNARPLLRPAEENEVETENVNELTDFVNENVEYGPGTRALQAFVLATKARALMHGRLSPTVDDVKTMAEPILRHRIGPSIGARASSIDETAIIKKLTDQIDRKYGGPKP